jgi:endonuclease YncB( thermonuclease family)
MITKKRIDHWDDGDSGAFTDGKSFRLNSVRAPESYQFGGERATRAVAGMTGRNGGFVRVQKVATDTYGREVVNLWNRDGSINQRMRARGYIRKGR